MAMQTGIGLSRILVLAGAGYTGTILVKNGKLSDFLGEIQSLVKGIEKSGEQTEGVSDYSDAIAQQVQRLAMEVRQLVSYRQITVLNGASGQIVILLSLYRMFCVSAECNYSGLIIPAATLGALGYGYMWWKGLKFSDLMYVTKRNMANAVANLTKHLEQVSETLSAVKKHLMQRIQLLDDKMESQKEISRAIQSDVQAASESISLISTEFWQLQRLVSGLDGKIGTLEEKQDFANMGVLYLCNFVGGKKMQMPKALKEQLKPSRRTRASLTFTETPSLTGLKEIAENLSQSVNGPANDVILPVGINNVEDQSQSLRSDQPKNLPRFNAVRC